MLLNVDSEPSFPLNVVENAENLYTKHVWYQTNDVTWSYESRGLKDVSLAGSICDCGSRNTSQCSGEGLSLVYSISDELGEYVLSLVGFVLFEGLRRLRPKVVLVQHLFRVLMLKGLNLLGPAGPWIFLAKSFPYLIVGINIEKTRSTCTNSFRCFCTLYSIDVSSGT